MLSHYHKAYFPFLTQYIDLLKAWVEENLDLYKVGKTPLLDDKRL